MTVLYSPNRHDDVFLAEHLTHSSVYPFIKHVIGVRLAPPFENREWWGILFRDSSNGGVLLSPAFTQERKGPTDRALE